MPRVQDAIPSLDCRAWKGCSNPLFLSGCASLRNPGGALQTKDLARVTVDTTVQPKNIAFPADAKLLHAAIKGFNRLARKQVCDCGNRMRASPSAPP
jgi:hypothetical protein